MGSRLVCEGRDNLGLRMKRCPECNFVYLDADEVCDLDGTPLVRAEDAEFGWGTDLETKVAQTPGITAQPPGRSRKALAAGVVGGLALGAVVLFIVYYGIAQKSRQAAQAQEQSAQDPLSGRAIAPQLKPSLTQTPPTLAASPSLDTYSSTARSTPSPRPVASRGAPVSSDPVSTGANESAKTGRVVIQLKNGVRVEADEAWRTKEGVWYRRNGIVTLIKANRVKAIEKTPPR